MRCELREVCIIVFFVSSCRPRPEAASPTGSQSTMAPVAMGLQAMPRGAAVYGVLGLGQLREALRPVRHSESLQANLETLFSAGVDGSKPAYFAVAATPHEGPSAFFAHFQKVAEGKANATSAPSREYAHLARVLVPLKEGVNPVLAVEQLAKGINGKFESQSCSNVSCPVTPSAWTSVGVVHGFRDTVAVYATAGMLKVDIARQVFEREAAASTWLRARLAAFADETGGPAIGKCALLKTDNIASTCLDAAAIAETGTSAGYGQTFSALVGAGIGPSDVAPIAHEGRRESEANLALAAFRPRYFEDATFTWLSKGDRLEASWAVAGEAATKLAATLKVERCIVKSRDAIEVEKLIGQAFSQKADKARASELLGKAGDGGAAGMLILGSTLWPVGIGMEYGPLQTLVGTRACMSFRDGRLQASVGDVTLRVLEVIDR